jgi:hypothetical protein
MEAYKMKENNPKCYGLWCLFIICLLIIIPFYTSCERPGDGDDNNTQDDNGTETFTIGDVSLTASTTETGGSQTVVVTDDDGNAVVSAVATISEAMLTLPDSSKHLITFDEPLSSLPAAFELNRAAVFIAYQIVSNIGDGSVAMRRDNPGCDLFYDYQCMLGCCADHDFCFDENNCTFYSWSLIYDSVPECRNCNDIAFACIIRSCYKGQTPKDQGTCYDNRCNMFYDCDSGYCDCTSPCALEICDNKKDDDGDTFEDCDDADCSPHSACIEICDNNKDDDGDYLVDCDDANCAGHGKAFGVKSLS